MSVYYYCLYWKICSCPNYKEKSIKSQNKMHTCAQGIMTTIPAISKYSNLIKCKSQQLADNSMPTILITYPFLIVMIQLGIQLVKNVIVMNKNQKYLAQNPYSCPQNQHRPIIRVSSSQTLFKQAANVVVLVVNSIQQEAQLLDHLSWRHRTSAPIVRILSFASEESDYGFPKLFKIEIEPMVRPVQTLREIGLGDSLYLIKSMIVGVQQLASNYLKIDIGHLSYSLNSKNECKVWVSVNFANFHPETTRGLSPAPPHFVIQSIINIVYSVSNKAAKSQLNHLVQLNKNYPNLSYDRALRKLDLFLTKKGIVLGQSLGTSQSRLQEDKLPVKLQENIRCEGKPTKVNFRYYSPTSKQLKEQPLKVGYKSCFLQKQVPKVNWHYESNHIGSMTTRSRLSTAPVMEMNSQKSVRPQQGVQNLLKSPGILKNKLLTGKRAEQNNFQQAEQKIIYNPELKSEGNSKNSLTATTEVSQLIPTNEASRHEQNMAKQEEKYANLAINKKNQFTFLPQPSAFQKSQSYWELGREKKDSIKWEFKLKNLLFGNQEQLKQSIHCGQEVRSAQLDVKLQFLGHMGRDITSTIQDSSSA